MSERHDISKRPEGLFHHALSEAQVGDEIIYHVGPHAAGPHKKDAYETYSDGHCILYQRRIRRSLFEYVAKKRGRK